MTVAYESFRDGLAALELALHGRPLVERVLGCASVYLAYDSLCFMDGPLDRNMLRRRLDDAIAWAQGLSRAEPQYTGDFASCPEHARVDRLEDQTADLYAQCWLLYDDLQFKQSAGLLEKRLAANSIDQSFVRGADCLDAGSGSGRFCYALVNLGAARVTGIDLSAAAIRAAAIRMRRLGLAESAVTFIVGSILKMPADWHDRFDVVVCNGVLHCTADSTRGLAELFRVLRPGGRAIVFVYGGGGLRWAITDTARRLLPPAAMPIAWQTLGLLDLQPHQRYGMIDDWFVPIVELSTRDGFAARLRQAGFSGIRCLDRGYEAFDSAERRSRYPDDADLLGEGDLRYVATKPGPG